MATPEKAEQILQTHASLVLAVVQTINNPQFKPQLDHVLQQSAQNGWADLVNVINKIVAGNRDQALLNGLDDEDAVIVDSILRGLQDPGTLPSSEQTGDASKAAPMLARMINEASRGDHNALSMLGAMAEQMSRAGGDMANLSAVVKEMIDGDHNALSMLGAMAEQMSRAGGDMANLSAVVKEMIDGERSIDKLCTRMGVQGESLITQIISELAKLDTH